MCSHVGRVPVVDTEQKKVVHLAARKLVAEEQPWKRKKAKQFEVVCPVKTFGQTNPVAQTDGQKRAVMWKIQLKHPNWIAAQNDVACWKVKAEATRVGELA